MNPESLADQPTQPPPEAVVSNPGPDAPIVPAAGIPSLPGYPVLGDLAQGGMGRVLRARDDRLGREMALKVLRDHLLGHADTAARFVAEARLTGRLQHPGIVPVYVLALFGQRWLVKGLTQGGVK